MRSNQELLLTSDIHLGSNLTRTLDFRQFLEDFIRNDNYQFVKNFVILGDLLELMLNKINIIMSDNEIKPIFNLLREISNMGVRLHYILGNHDISFVGNFETEKESFQNTLLAYNFNIFNSISQFASFSFNNGFIPFDNIGEYTFNQSREPQYLFLHGHQFDDPFIMPIEQNIWDKNIKDDQIGVKQLCDYLKNYCGDCYLRNQGKFLPAWEEFKDFYHKIDKLTLSQEEIIRLWTFKEYLRYWLLGKSLKRYPFILKSYKDKIFSRVINFLKSNNLIGYFSYIFFGHTHISGFYESIPSNFYSSNFPKLLNTGTWQKSEYNPYIIRLSDTSGIEIYTV